MNKEKRLEIFRSIQKLGSIWGKADCVEMLESIWNLHLFTSEDPRFKDAYGDAVQHLRNNDDWDEEYTFLTRFGLLTANDEVFHKFLNAVVSKNARSSKKEIERYVDTLNPLLRKEGIYNPQIQIFAESETKRPFFECSFKTKRTKKDLRTTQTTKPEIRAKTALFRALSKAI